MKAVFALFLTCSIHSAGAYAHQLPVQHLYISSEVLENQQETFIEHIGAPENPYGTTLAMNIQYAPVRALRSQIEDRLGQNSPLKIFTGFAKEGEAHVTTVTPIEYHRTLKPFVTPERMSEIARAYNIQSSDLEILGLGRGQAVLNGKNEDTYFIIVRSENLLRIRRAIYQDYIRAGGDPHAWNPEHFFPHITIGFTARDLHESDGVQKDIKNSLDSRFLLQMTDHKKPFL